MDHGLPGSLPAAPAARSSPAAGAAPSSARPDPAPVPLASASRCSGPAPGTGSPPAPARTFRPTARGAACSAQPRRLAALRVHPVRDHVHVRLPVPVRHDQRLVPLHPQRLQALLRRPHHLWPLRLLILGPTQRIVAHRLLQLRVSGRSVRFCTLSGAFLTSVEVPIERRAVDTKLLRHLTC